MSQAPVTLQISLAPSDWRHARLLLQHQVATWRNQVSEILLTIDLHRSSGRFASNWETGRDNILALAASIEGARVEEIDYGEDARSRVSEEFFAGAKVPEKDFRGGPYYSYFYALHAARNDTVLHTDSDIFFGGGSQTWAKEAVDSMLAHPELLVTAPLPGPPSPDGRLKHLRSTREPGDGISHRMTEMSSRVFMLSKSRFREAVGALDPVAPLSLRSRIKAFVEGNPSADLPEHLFTREMKLRGLFRRDFLGSEPGMWTLHPPYRCADFYEKLPILVARVERGDVPEAQRGDHDVNSSLVDWTEATDALARNRWWRRLLKR
jgi:hypothetical protein